ncbi:aromatic-ring-hydroxylating dioxygenase subunit beta [Ramlibacter tataouinensis]|uniref:Candidate salicylate-5-hydroxylase small oxygenase component n=1 Tax=Ramlibacter tataouinensis (strain ATCC BAA-407 / DSM 14655 / LMG 21543 / TTB310) TaxID=365046 RepID=F5Y3P2_RAMTT|nr:aromatic-ring-hydroxylating dioxygenase subunit beta [Ramlibacter tataouinensis]AEG93699.1 Candidate salicylate-5-hydroxylase small oxygenase component [Ramlibacter tataouinensis TTB310]
MSAALPERLLLQLEVDQLNAAYAASLDERRFDDWPEFFLDDASYQVQARENFDRGLPLALMALESKGMMKDRVYGITQTIYHAPYYTRHLVGPAQVLSVEGGLVRAQAHYAVFRTRPGDASEVYNVGRYIDEIERTPAGLRLRSRRCVYDSEMVLNSLIYPI